MRLWIAGALMLALMTASAAGIQTAVETAPASFVFDVASIKPGSAERRTRIFRHPDDAEFGAQNVSLKALVQFAYGVTEDRVIGFPAGLQDAHFDVEAHPDLATAARFRALKPDESREAKQHMVQDLLAARCHLEVHRETRVLPVYALVVGRGGPKFGPSEDPNSNWARGGWNHIEIEGGESMARLAEELSRVSGRPVVDRTGLTGRYDLELEWSDDDDEDSAAATLFTAVSEQLGLRLQAEKAPVDVVVVDHIELPSEN
jgi:uncharacterized protein (TIGR03435 family)